jgi:hypothetical protein
MDEQTICNAVIQSRNWQSEREFLQTNGCQPSLEKLLCAAIKGLRTRQETVSRGEALCEMHVPVFELLSDDPGTRHAVWKKIALVLGNSLAALFPGKPPLST